jgi:hypothetical protein
MTCWYCPSLGYRCVDPQSVNGSCNICKQQIVVENNKNQDTLIMQGICTWYGGPNHDGRAMRNGEPYDPTALTCAVPAELWRELQGKMLYIQAVDAPWRGVWVTVTDTGWLTEAGEFCRNPDTTLWDTCTAGLRIVIDLSPAAHLELGTLDTIPVQVFDLQN